MPALEPLPQIKLRDDPNQDAIWKRWLSRLQSNVSTLGGFASGSVPFAASDGTLTSDTNFTYNSTTDVLTVNGSTFGLNTQVGGTLGVTGNTTLTGDLAVNGGDLTSSATTFNLLNATVTTLNVGSAADVNLGVAGKTFTVTGTTELTGNVRVGSSVAPTVALDVTGAALISTTLGVTGAATLSSTLGVTGLTTATGGLAVSRSE